MNSLPVVSARANDRGDAPTFPQLQEGIGVDRFRHRGHLQKAIEHIFFNTSFKSKTQESTVGLIRLLRFLLQYKIIWISYEHVHDLKGH